MGQGSYVFAEFDSVFKQDPVFQQTMRQMEQTAILKCTNDWFPKKTPTQACGYLNPKSGEQFGRTTILPALFDNHSGVQMAHWRQLFTVAGHQTLMAGSGTGNILPEDFKVALVGFAFPNKNMHVTEIKMQIGDRKYGRIDLEELHLFNKPAIIFEEGYLVNEEEAFDLYGYIEGPIPTDMSGQVGVFQRIVPLGAAYYKQIDRVLGNPGAAI